MDLTIRITKDKIGVSSDCTLLVIYTQVNLVNADQFEGFQLISIAKSFAKS